MLPLAALYLSGSAYVLYAILRHHEYVMDGFEGRWRIFADVVCALLVAFWPLVLLIAVYREWRD